MSIDDEMDESNNSEDSSDEQTVKKTATQKYSEYDIMSKATPLKKEDSTMSLEMDFDRVCQMVQKQA